MEAVRQLVRIERDSAFVSRLQMDMDDPRDIRLLSDLVRGVTRLKRRFDFLISQFYHGPLNQLDAPILQVLRIGLYEILERETPPHAAVSEAVSVAKKASGKGAAGLVNAILRSVLRAQESQELPVPGTGKRERDLAIQHSHPTWLVRRWLERFGESEAIALLEANNARPAYGIRANDLLTTRQELIEQLNSLGVKTRVSKYLNDFLVVEQLQPLIQNEVIGSGVCVVQDEAAGLVVHILDPQSGDSVLDAAAAPGGKALYAAARMGNKGHIVANDIHDSRTRLIESAARTQGIHIIETHVGDLRDFDHSAHFERVLLDAPCSGTGVLAKRSDLRWNTSFEKLTDLVALQDELLDAASKHVSLGGLLVYATCSIEREENEDRVGAFLSRHPGYALEAVESIVPDEMYTQAGFYQALPHTHQTDGAFAARLRKHG